MRINSQEKNMILKHRVERCHRLLEDDRDRVAADVVHIRQGQGGQLHSVKADAAAGDIAVVVQQAQDAHGGDRLARSGFADDADGASGFQ